mmetsp:Transcript_25252/g.58141  ORF Transcript_25252/g.58141 Transcript_25252/m.58141 type:complete len:619 (-) Transcript_25252:110-1966(-)
MPLKRPPPLADSALFPQGRLPNDACVGTETKKGFQLTVKNTFLDVPTTLHSTLLARNLPQQSAPAELSLEPGFIGRAVAGAPGLDDPEDEKVGPCGTPSSPRMCSNRSGQTNKAPGSGLSTSSGLGGSLAASTGLSTPLATPSPNGQAMGLFSILRQPQPCAPSQETQHPALGTVHNNSPLGVIGTQTNGAQAKEPCSAGWLGCTMPAPGLVAGVPYASALPYRPAAEAAKATQLDAVEQGASSKADDESQDSEAEDGMPSKGVEDIPKPPPGAEHPSLGSQAHDQGTCKRCCFYPRNRCLNGYNCDFCHYDHEKRKRKSKKKKKKSDKDGAGDGQGGSDDENDVSMHVEHGLTAQALEGVPQLVGTSPEMQLSMMASALQVQDLEVPMAPYYNSAAGLSERIEVQPIVVPDSGQILSTPAPPMSASVYMNAVQELCHAEYCNSMMDMNSVDMDPMMMWPSYESYDPYAYGSSEHDWMGTELMYDMSAMAQSVLDMQGYAAELGSDAPSMLPSVHEATSYAGLMQQGVPEEHAEVPVTASEPPATPPIEKSPDGPPSYPPSASALPTLDESSLDPLSTVAPPLCSPKLPKELFNDTDSDSSDEDHPKDQTHSNSDRLT